MGIQGLTTFINANSKQYFDKHHLHDTYLVLDGYNIASHLYKWHCKRNDCFGGDYDKYAKVVYDFFKLLETCNITPIIIFDGGYENKKLKTIYRRLKNKIYTAKHLNCVTQGGITMFPLFLRELFVGLVLKLGLKAIQCDLEADYEMACVAKWLGCPVLSYDSDFYIFDVLYIPFSTFEMIAQKVKGTSTPCYFIQCQIFRIEKFLNSVGGLQKETLPLMATLLGNDYIKKSMFKNFYAGLKLSKSRRGQSKQQLKILAVIKWLQNETYDSAVVKILSKLKLTDRRFVAEQIKISTETYLNYKSEVLQYLNVMLPQEINPTNFTFNCEKYLERAKSIEDDCSKSDPTSATSESEEELDIAIETKLNNHIPDWFHEQFRRCTYPQSFMDILCHNIYISTPQVENYDNISSHSISYPILAVIQKILVPTTLESLTCAGRLDYGSQIKNVKIQICIKTLPTLSDIPSLKCAKNILLQALDLTDCIGLEQLLNILPSTWQLYYISMIYWIKHASPQVYYSHLYSLILCTFILNKVDSQIGYYRSSYKFTSTFNGKINHLLNKQRVTPSVQMDFKESFDNIDYDECLLSYKEFIEYFQMDQKMRTYLKLFDIHILDCFAQFQSCLLHIQYLNSLLNKPFCNFLISEFYDGTFLFNMCLNLSKRNNIEIYLKQTLLKHSPHIFNCVKNIFEIVVQISSDSLASSTSKKRRKKKKKTSSIVNEDCIKEDLKSEDENIEDSNNRFSILSLMK